LPPARPAGKLAGDLGNNRFTGGGEAMDQVLHYLNEILDFFQAGFNHVNALLGIIIALVAAIKLTAWRGLWEIALVSTLVHIIITIVTTAPIRLPPLFAMNFWRDTAAMYAGYVIVIAVFYFLRTKLIKSGDHKN
jgi:hypothetical protein